MAADPGAPALGTPLWWVNRLSRRLDRRLGLAPHRDGRYGTSIARWQSYYDGELNLALTSDKWRAEFASRFPNYSANFMATVVDKHRERLAVQGIRYASSSQADDDAWRWWQSQHMDAQAPILFRGALVKGSSYILVWPDAKGEPQISVESASEVVVDTVSGRPWERRAAMKRWVSHDDDRVHVELYLPGGVFKFRSTQSSIGFSAPTWISVVAWEPERITGEDWPINNPIGLVPMVPFIAQPNEHGEGQSVIRPVATIQDAINKYRVDAFVASEFASFKQRWAIGLDIPIDPETKQAVEPFRSAVDRLWAVGPPDPNQYPDASKAPRVEFGEFDITPLGPFYEAIEGEIKMMGTISRIPYHQLSPQAGQPPSGDSIRSSESGLVAMITDTEMAFGEAVEEVVRLNFAFRGDKRADETTAEVLWREAATQSEAQRMAALGVQLQLGVPEEAIWEQIPGVTPQTIKRWKRMKAEAELEDALKAPAAPSPPVRRLPAPTPPAGG